MNRGFQTKSVVTLLLFLFAVCVALVGCSSNVAEKEGELEDNGDIGKKDEYGGILKIGITSDVIVLGDPKSSFRNSDRLPPSPAIERLFVIGEDGQPKPFLVEDYQIADDHSSIILTLKKGIQFHDGTPFNGEAVKWNLEEYKKTGRAELEAIESIELLDEYSLKLNLSFFDSLLLANLSGFPGMMISPQSYQENGEEWAMTHPVGTGPFKFKEWIREERIVFERFDGYWQDGKPYLDGIHFLVIPDSTTMESAFKNQEIDVMLGIDPRTGHVLKQEGYKVFATPQPTAVMSLQPDSRKEDSVFHDIRVRQAVWHAIDTESIAQTVGYGYLIATNQLAIPSSWAYNGEVDGYPYNPEKAKQLLAEAGYANGFSTNLYGLNVGIYPDTLTAIQNFLTEVGIEAKLHLLGPQQYDEIVVHRGWSDGLTMIPFTVTPNELGAYFRLMSREVQPVRMKPVWASEQTFDLIEQAMETPDYEQMTNAVHQLQKVVTDQDATVIWLFGQLGVGAAHEYVKNGQFYYPNSFEWVPEDVKVEK